MRPYPHDSATALYCCTKKAGTREQDTKRTKETIASVSVM